MASGPMTLDIFVLESCFSTLSGVMMNLSRIGSWCSLNLTSVSGTRSLDTDANALFRSASFETFPSYLLLARFCKESFFLPSPKNDFTFFHHFLFECPTSDNLLYVKVYRLFLKELFKTSNSRKHQFFRHIVWHALT